MKNYTHKYKFRKFKTLKKETNYKTNSIKIDNQKKNYNNCEKTIKVKKQNIIAFNISYFSLKISWRPIKTKIPKFMNKGLELYLKLISTKNNSAIGKK